MEIAKEMAKWVPVILAMNYKQAGNFSNAFKKQGVINLQGLCKIGTFAEMQA